MTKTATVLFGVFRRFLEGVLGFRNYRDDEPVFPRDVLRIRKMFELRGLMEPEDFHARLLRANTPA